jgi:signal peptidase II
MLALCLSFFIALLDQISKFAIKSIFVPGEHVAVVPGFFDVVYVQNTGAAWGKLSGFNNWLILVSLAMVIVLVAFRRHFISNSLTHRIVMGLMIGGVVGNLIDRMKWGFVIDFLDFHWREAYHFPAFNVADSAICIGVGLYIITQVFDTKKAESQKSAVADQKSETRPLTAEH